MPGEVGGSTRITGFNLRNDFTALGERGAETAQELERQRAKLIAALGAIDADLVGLVALENNGDAAIGDLIGRLNVALGRPACTALPDPAFIGDDEIKVGMILKPDQVTPVGEPMSADPDRNPLYSAFKRPPVGQVFQTDSERFAVVVNHFKSKGCSEATRLNQDQGGGQGRVRPSDGTG